MTHARTGSSRGSRGEGLNTRTESSGSRNSLTNLDRGTIVEVVCMMDSW